MVGIDGLEFEKLFYLYIRKNPDYIRNINPDFFDSNEVATLYKISKAFFDRFAEMPSKDQIRMLVKKSPQIATLLTDGIIDVIFDEDLASYDQVWLQETCESWIIWKALDKSIFDTIEYIKGVKVTPDNVKDIVNKVKSLINERNNISFDVDMGLNFFDINSHIPKLHSKITSCHNWVDDLLGGYRKKSLIVYCGEANVGKSIFLANDATNYIRAGIDVAVITAEMSSTDYVYRIGSNLLNIDINEYEKIAKSNPDLIQRKLDQSSGLMPLGALYIKEYPTSQATVPEIELYLKELELSKGIKLGAIVIDYINILSNWRNPNSENTYIKIKQLSEDLRGMAVRNEWVIITATQLKLNGYSSSDMSMKDIAESSGLGHTCDVIFGIIQDADMQLANEYWLKLLKIRHGGGKFRKCRYTIDYSHMRLAETMDILNAGD